MSAPLTMETVAEVTKRIKLDTVRRNGDDPDDTAADIQAAALVVRNGGLIAELRAGTGTEALRTIGFYAAAVFPATDVYLTGDVLLKSDVTPEDAETVQPGDLQRAWGEGSRDGLTEAVLVYHFPAPGTGDPRMLTMPYERHGTSLRWMEPMLCKVAETQGAVPKMVMAGFARGRDHFLALKEMISSVLAMDPTAADAELRSVALHASGRFVSAQDHVGSVAVYGTTVAVLYVDGNEYPYQEPESL